MIIEDNTISKLNLESNPGDITVITGFNGSGKTTLIKILANIIEPSRGKILIDDIDIGQLSSNWYRSQIAYSPQEPQFIDGTLGENIVGATKIEHTQLQQIMKTVDLLNYVNSHEKGINMQLDNRGEDMPLGIRKRIGHARSLINDAKLILFQDLNEVLLPIREKVQDLQTRESDIEELLQENAKKVRKLTIPRDKGSSGPTKTKSILCNLINLRSLLKLSISTSIFFAKFSVPAFPGKQNIFLHNFDSCNFLQRACSLPPLPINPIFM